MKHIHHVPVNRAANLKEGTIMHGKKKCAPVSRDISYTVCRAPVKSLADLSKTLFLPNTTVNRISPQSERN